MSTPVRNTRTGPTRYALIINFCAAFLMVPAQGANQSSLEIRALTSDFPDSSTTTRNLLSGRDFQDVLQKWVSTSWQTVDEGKPTKTPVRHIFRRLSETFEIAVILDRRIDPSRTVNVTLKSQKLVDILRSVADLAGGATSVPSDCVFVGPPQRASQLRTLIELRSDELFELTGAQAKRRQLTLARRPRLAWSDLDTPIDILRQVEQVYGLKINGIELVPHDLWAEATLPHATAAEALSIVLIQFDLTFEWSPDASAVSLVPIPNNVSIRRTYSNRNTRPNDIAARIHQRFADVHTEIDGSRLLVDATLEQHEEIRVILNPRMPRGLANVSARSNNPPLSRRRFTLNVKDAPVGAVMQQLRDSDVVFEYDDREMQLAGIDFRHTVSINVTQATADEFFHAVFSPIGVKFEIDGLKVTLRLANE